MSRLRLPLLFLSALLLVPFTPAQAIEPDPWTRAAAAYNRADRSEARLELRIETLLQTFYDPEQVSQIESICPGYRSGLADLMRPFDIRYREPILDGFEADLAKIFRQHMSQEEMVAAADFFETEEFQRFQMATVFENSTAARDAAREQSKDYSASRDALMEDTNATLPRIEARIGSEAYARIADTLSNSFWSKAYLATTDPTIDLSSRAENTPMPAELQAEYLVAEHKFMTEWSAKCGFTYAPAGDADAQENASERAGTATDDKGTIAEHVS